MQYTQSYGCPVLFLQDILLFIFYILLLLFYYFLLLFIFYYLIFYMSSIIFARYFANIGHYINARHSEQLVVKDLDVPCLQTILLAFGNSICLTTIAAQWRKDFVFTNLGRCVSVLAEFEYSKPTVSGYEWNNVCQVCMYVSSFNSLVQKQKSIVDNDKSMVENEKLMVENEIDGRQ